MAERSQLHTAHSGEPKRATAAESWTIEPPKIIEIIVSKQTQYYALWAGYTAVQFTAGSFGSNMSSVPLSIGAAVILGVWAFNIGHLSFVLECVLQINKLTIALNAAMNKPKAVYRDASRAALDALQQGGSFWLFLKRERGLRSLRVNTFVHLFIDICASIALLVRIDYEWLGSILTFVGK